ncbi:uncharacterized protein BDV14DRAFT_161676 [Aspergillus stella-maris]|uniref:uncharacterized protein n=1 Tax=Aspergillus stella-maris TaxID=1810926 RepID=UPI003CCD3AE5
MPTKCNSSTAGYGLALLVASISLIFGALSWSQTRSLHLPLPTWVPALATLFAPLTPLLLITLRIFADTLARSQTSSVNITTLPQLLSHIHTILLSTIATLALAYLYPESILSCNLEQQWQSFFKSKNSAAIRSIQDRYQCCGLRSIHDRAWPFKDKTHGDNACKLQFGYNRPCIQQWASGQIGVSWMVFVAVVGGLVVKVIFAQVSVRRASWMNSQFTNTGRERQRISGPELENGDVDGHVENEGEARRTLLPQSRPGQGNVWDAE